MTRLLCIGSAVAIAIVAGHWRDALHGLAMCGAPALTLALWVLIDRAGAR